MRKKSLQSLCRYYEVGDFYGYIVDSYINGARSQCVELFCELKKADRGGFIDYAREICPEAAEYIVRNVICK